MKNNLVRNTILLVLSFLINTNSFAQERSDIHSDEIVNKILRMKQEIIKDSGKKPDSFIFLSFWDFDGTIIKGDCSEGFTDNGKVEYNGLAKVAIDKGYSNIYSSKDGSDKFYNEYHHMAEEIGDWLALPFLAQIFEGTNVDEISKTSEEYLNNTQSKYFFKSSIDIMESLEGNEVECHVISASPEFFVVGASSSLGLPKDRFNGIQVKIVDGKLTNELIYPITRSYGKVDRLKQIVKKIESENPGKEIVILAGFGNSYNTDGPFLKYISQQNIITKKPLSVMINGGKSPKEYDGLFMKVNQSSTIGNK